MKKTLCVSPSCGPCSMLKSKLNKMGIAYEEKNFSNSDDKEFFFKHQIKSVPRLVVEDGDDVRIIQGMEDIIEELKKQDA